MMTDLNALAKQALDKRARLADARQQLLENRSLSDEQKKRATEPLDAQMDAFEREARSYASAAQGIPQTDAPTVARRAVQPEIRTATEAVAETETRTAAEAAAQERRDLLMAKATALAVRRPTGSGGSSFTIRSGGSVEAPEWGSRPKDEWRSLVPSDAELRTLQASGNTSLIPVETASTAIDRLVGESKFLSAPGLNIVHMDTAVQRLPLLLTEPIVGTVAEYATIPKGDSEWGNVNLTSKKFAAIQTATSEILEDSSIDMRQRISTNLVRAVAGSVDQQAFTGNGTGENLKGVVGQAITPGFLPGMLDFKEIVPVSGGGTQTRLWKIPGYDTISYGLNAIERANGTPTAIFVDPIVMHALRTAKAEASSTYHLGVPTGDRLDSVWGIPIISTPALLGTGGALAGDFTRVWFGIRKDIEVKYSEVPEWERDAVSYRVRFRCAGAAVDTPAAVQWLPGTFTIGS